MGKLEFCNTTFLYDDTKWTKELSKKKYRNNLILCTIVAIIIFVLMLGSVFLVDYFFSGLGTISIIIAMFFVLLILGVGLIGGVCFTMSIVYGEDSNLYEALDWVSYYKEFETVNANGRLLFIASKDDSKSISAEGLAYKLRVDEIEVIFDDDVKDNVKSEINMINYPSVTIRISNSN